MSDKLEAVIEPLLRFHESGGHEGDGSGKRIALIRASLRTPTPEQAEEVNAKDIAASVVQSACEADPADPEHPDTVAIGVSDLETIVRCAVENAQERAALQSTPPAQPTADAVERARLVTLLRNLDGETFDGEVTMSSGEAKSIIAALQTMAGDYVMVPRDLKEAWIQDAIDTACDGENRKTNGGDWEHRWERSRVAAMLSASPTGGE